MTHRLAYAAATSGLWRMKTATCLLACLPSLRMARKLRPAYRLPTFEGFLGIAVKLSGASVQNPPLSLCAGSLGWSTKVAAIKGSHGPTEVYLAMDRVSSSLDHSGSFLLFQWRIQT